MNTLSVEILASIFYFLDYESLCRISAVSKNFKYISSDKRLWEKLAKNDFHKTFDPKKTYRKKLLATRLAKTFGFPYEEVKYVEELFHNGKKMKLIPREINTMRNLERIEFSNNEITVIPEGIIKLRRLKHINLSNNQITHVPEILETMKNLISLLLSYNKITKYPSFLSHVRILDVSHNPLKG